MKTSDRINNLEAQIASMSAEVSKLTTVLGFFAQQMGGQVSTNPAPVPVQAPSTDVPAAPAAPKGSFLVDESAYKSLFRDETAPQSIAALRDRIAFKTTKCPSKRSPYRFGKVNPKVGKTATAKELSLYQAFLAAK